MTTTSLAQTVRWPGTIQDRAILHRLLVRMSFHPHSDDDISVYWIKLSPTEFRVGFTLPEKFWMTTEELHALKEEFMLEKMLA
ncbi:hypothetical protein KW790_03505 [Candidatus Parcubacteria bacterium]|nr:hypothetical protein [Candidatus Parcubacteria bacterium]